ncbi:hypothetical protein LCGC14_0249080 [marine sediment metagenome]|uniref:Uncharacterized protein n=1 Tax=marine sediment metagenome TaxID=412755 RepID=A0A0F9U549_9ZZZZ
MCEKEKVFCGLLSKAYIEGRRKSWCVCHKCKVVFEDDCPIVGSIKCPGCGHILERKVSLRLAKELIGVPV